MPELAHSPAPPVAAADGKRRWRNYLLDARFQLKFTGYIIGITLVIALILGGFLWNTSRTLMKEAEIAVHARPRVAETSKELSNATLANEVFQHMDDPAFEEQLKRKSAEIDAKYEAERREIVAQRAELVRKQRLVWLTLVGLLLAFVVVIALATIVTTHKVVGPLFRIKRMVHEIRSGRLVMPAYPLRQKDELKDVFEAMTQMVSALRDRQEGDAKVIGELIDRARAGGQDGLANELQALRAKMLTRLD